MAQASVASPSPRMPVLVLAKSHRATGSHGFGGAGAAQADKGPRPVRNGLQQRWRAADVVPVHERTHVTAQRLHPPIRVHLGCIRVSTVQTLVEASLRTSKERAVRLVVSPLTSQQAKHSRAQNGRRIKSLSNHIRGRYWACNCSDSGVMDFFYTNLQCQAPGAPCVPLSSCCGSGPSRLPANRTAARQRTPPGRTSALRHTCRSFVPPGHVRARDAIL